MGGTKKEGDQECGDTLFLPWFPGVHSKATESTDFVPKRGLVYSPGSSSFFKAFLLARLTHVKC